MYVYDTYVHDVYMCIYCVRVHMLHMCCFCCCDYMHVACMRVHAQHYTYVYHHRNLEKSPKISKLRGLVNLFQS